MKVYLLKISAIQGNSAPPHHEIAFTHQQTAVLRAEDLNGEFETYTPEEATGEELDAHRVAVGRLIFKLDKSTPDDVHKERALAKLTEAEKKALMPESLYNNPYKTLVRLQEYPALRFGWDEQSRSWVVVGNGHKLAINACPLAAVEAAITEIEK